MKCNPNTVFYIKTMQKFILKDASLEQPLLVVSRLKIRNPYSLPLSSYRALPIMRKISPLHPLSPLLLILSKGARFELLLVEVLQAGISTND
jgi:hypothetical protein